MHRRWWATVMAHSTATVAPATTTAAGATTTTGRGVLLLRAAHGGTALRALAVGKLNNQGRRAALTYVHTRADTHTDTQTHRHTDT